MNYIIQEALLQEVLKYLISQPYANVALLIGKLQRLEKAEKPKANQKS